MKYEKSKIKTILILTSKDHLYSNLILNKILRSKIIDDKKVIVLEQDWIVSGKSKLKGIITYLKISGLNYVIHQIAKQYLFLFL